MDDTLVMYIVGDTARFGIDTFGIGEDSGQPVTDAYQSPFEFTGTIEKVVIGTE